MGVEREGVEREGVEREGVEREGSALSAEREARAFCMRPRLPSRPGAAYSEKASVMSSALLRASVRSLIIESS